MMKPAPPKIIYTILANDVPVAAVEATGVEAKELWFLAELAALKVDGEPIYKPVTKLRVRPATEAEWTIYEKESSAAEDDDELFFVYLVNLDRDNL